MKFDCVIPYNFIKECVKAGKTNQEICDIINNLLVKPDMTPEKVENIKNMAKW